MSTAGIVYGEQSGIIRYIMLPARDFTSLNYVNLQDGEQMATVDYEGEFEIETAEKIVESIRGKPSDDPRCAVLDAKGKVLEIIAADPILDKVGAGKSLLKAKNAEVGMVLDAVSGDFISEIPVELEVM